METKCKMPIPTIVIITICAIILLLILGMIFFPMIFGSSELQPGASATTEDDTLLVSSVFDDAVSTTVPGGQTVTESVLSPEIYPVDENCMQFVFAYCSGTNVDITFYEKIDGVWVELMKTQGVCGEKGITYNKTDGDGKTPAGEFDLTFCYGISKPDTKMNFEWVDTNTVWVNDPDSQYYNTIQAEVIDGAWKSAESLYDGYFDDGEHNYCINIAANGDGLTPGSAVSGKGSIITLCGKTSSLAPTKGCIDIPANDMVSLLGYLDSSKNPEIIIY